MSAPSVTGDVRNNINKLRKELALVKYRPPHGGANANRHHPASFDAAERRFLEGLLSGSPQTILPILHHALLDYSRLLANHLFERGLYDLYAKTDARFLESVWRVCRDEFGYRPTIKKEHLLSKSGKYVERKVMFATDFVAECRKKHAELARLSRPGSAGRFRHQSDTERTLGSAGPPSRRASSGNPEEELLPSTLSSSSRGNSALGYRNGVLKEKQEQAASTRRQGPTARRPTTTAAAPSVARAWRTDAKQTRYCAAPFGPQMAEYEDQIRTANIVPTAHPSAMLHSIELRQFQAHRPLGDKNSPIGIEDARRAADSAGADTAGDAASTSEVHDEPPGPLKPRSGERSRGGKQHACAVQQHLLTAAGSPTFSGSQDEPTLWSYLTPGRQNGTTGSEKQEIVAVRPPLSPRKPFENGESPGPKVAVDSAAECEARSPNGVSAPAACHPVAREACHSRAAQRSRVSGGRARLRVSPPEPTSTLTNGTSLQPSPSRQISDPLGRRGASQNGGFQSAECEARNPHRGRETSAAGSGFDEEADGKPRIEPQEVEALAMSDSDEIREMPPRRIDRQRSIAVSDDVPLSAALEDVLEEVEANLTDFARHLRTVNSHLRSLDARIAAVERRLEECAVEPLPANLQGSAADPSHRRVTSETYRLEASGDGLKQDATSPERGRCQLGEGNSEETLPADDRRNSRGASSESSAPAQSASTGLREMTPPPGDSNAPRQTEPVRRSPSPCKPDGRALAPTTTGVESEKAGRLIQNISERFRVTRLLLGKDAGGERGRAVR